MPIRIKFTKKIIHLLGIMSGTSCDGIDLALIRMNMKQPDYRNIHIIRTQFFPYPKELRTYLDTIIIDQNIGFSTYVDLERRLTILHADAISAFQEEETKIDLIGVHGQTLFHDAPSPTRFGLSWQIVSHEQLAKLVKIPCVGDFRNGDMALGGHGAPLISYFDYLMFNKVHRSQLILNIGGISNGTFLPEMCDRGQIISGDFGPGNTLIDQATLHLFNKNFDRYGHLSIQGKIDLSLLTLWTKRTPYINRAFPKSTGRELFSKIYLNDLLDDCRKRKLSRYSVLATISAFTVSCIKKQLLMNIDEVIVTGGGAKNKFLMSLIENEIGKIVPVSNQLIDFKEAIAFALLAFHYIRKEPSSFPNTTGTRKATILGSMAW